LLRVREHGALLPGLLVRVGTILIPDANVMVVLIDVGNTFKLDCVSVMFEGNNRTRSYILASKPIKTKGGG
jgi:hypothetical protein